MLYVEKESGSRLGPDARYKRRPAMGKVRTQSVSLPTQWLARVESVLGETRNPIRERHNGTDLCMGGGDAST